MGDTRALGNWRLVASILVALVLLLWLLLSPPGQGTLKQSSLNANDDSATDISKARTFSSVIKSGQLTPGEETELFSSSDGPGYTTEQWFTFPGIGPHTIVRVFVDGESSPSIEYNLHLGHAIGCNATEESKLVPWNTAFISHNAPFSSAIKNNYRIPFGKSIRITVVPPKTVHNSGSSFPKFEYIYWYIIHGVLNAPLVVGGHRLPNTARLRLYKQENRLVQPLDYITMVDVKKSAGWLFQIMMSAESLTLAFLEGCHRTEIDGGETQFFSSGTEDLFSGAFYFDGGIFHSDDVGLTCFQKPAVKDAYNYSQEELYMRLQKKYGDGPYPQSHVTAYKFFVKDPLLFHKSLRFRWRSGETATDNDRCPRTSQRTKAGLKGVSKGYPLPLKATVTLYSWVYHY